MASKSSKSWMYFTISYMGFLDQMNCGIRKSCPLKLFQTMAHILLKFLPLRNREKHLSKTSGFSGENKGFSREYRKEYFYWNSLENPLFSPENPDFLLKCFLQFRRGRNSGSMWAIVLNNINGQDLRIPQFIWSRKLVSEMVKNVTKLTLPFVEAV